MSADARSLYGTSQVIHQSSTGNKDTDIQSSCSLVANERSSRPAVSKESTRSTILFIQECGIKLDAKEITIATACMLYHRYRRLQTGRTYQQNNFCGSTTHETAHSGLCPNNHNDGEKKTNVLDDECTIASCCLLLAGKVEENHLNVRQLINVAYQTCFRDKELRSIDEYYAIRNSLMSLELWLLRSVSFQPTCQHPHKYLVCFLKSLENWLVPGTFQRYPIAAVSWSMLRDAYLSPLPIEEKPEHLAISIVAGTLELFGLSVPGDEKASHSWIKAFCKDLSSDHLERVVESLTEIYLEKRSF